MNTEHWEEVVARCPVCGSSHVSFCQTVNEYWTATFRRDKDTGHIYAEPDTLIDSDVVDEDNVLFCEACRHVADRSKFFAAGGE